MKRKKVIYILAGVVLALCIVLWGVVRFTATRQVMEFEMQVCSLEGEADMLSVDAVREGSIFEPVHYNGDLWFKGKQYAAYQKARRANRLVMIADNIKEGLRGVEYDIFLRTDTYDVSDKVIVRDVMYNEKDGSYSIWIVYSDSSLLDLKSGEVKIREFFGPASTAEDAEKIRDAFYEHYLNF